MFYTLADYHTIIEEKVQTVLPDSVKIIIDKVIKQLGVTIQTVYSKVSTITNHYNDQRKQRPNRRPNNNNSSNADWETLRSFKPTVIAEKEGSEKIMSDIRGSLNKMSQKNYDTNRDLIIGYMNAISEQETIKQIANNIFEIASTNKFFSEIYSKLYKELAEKYEIFSITLQDFLKGFMDRLHNIRFVDQNIDYDAYCSNNKINDATKASSLFITNLVKISVLSIDQVIDILYDIQKTIYDNVQIPDKTNEIEELTEHLFILLSPLSSLMNESERGRKILEKIREMSEWKLKEFPSISSRAIFKCKDLVEKL
jgi:MIF4G domain